MRENLDAVRHRLEDLFGEEGGLAAPILLLGIFLPSVVVGLVLLGTGVLGSPIAVPSILLPFGQEAISVPPNPQPKTGPTAQQLAGELDKAIDATRNNSWKINNQLAKVKDRLAAEGKALQGMRTLVEEMKKDSSPNPVPGASSGTIEIKNGALELQYKGWQTTNADFRAAASELDALLGQVEGQSSLTRQTARDLQNVLRQSPMVQQLSPSPGDEEELLRSYQRAADAARQDLTSARAADADYQKSANDLLSQGKALVEGARRTAQASGPFQFQRGFKALADQIPTVVGVPVEEEHLDQASGNMIQRTTRGLMVWRKADNWTGFTDGSRTWFVVPDGVQARANDGQ